MVYSAILFLVFGTLCVFCLFKLTTSTYKIVKGHFIVEDDKRLENLVVACLSFGAALFLILGFLLTLELFGINTSTEPTAMDVYRNKTELKILSSNGGVTTDSVVVWKDIKLLNNK